MGKLADKAMGKLKKAEKEAGKKRKKSSSTPADKIAAALLAEGAVDEEEMREWKAVAKETAAKGGDKVRSCVCVSVSVPRRVAAGFICARSLNS